MERVYKSDRELIEGLLSGEAAREREFADELGKAVWGVIARSYPGGRPQYMEWLGDCFELLGRWRKEGKVRLDEPLPFLANRLLNQVVKTRKRARRLQLARESQFANEADDEIHPTASAFPEALASERLWERLAALASTLTPALQATFSALRVHARDGSPEPHESLGCEESDLRRRTYRLRQALIPLAVNAGLLRQAAGGRWEVSDGD